MLIIGIALIALGSIFFINRCLADLTNHLISTMNRIARALEMIESTIRKF